MGDFLFSGQVGEYIDDESSKRKSTHGQHIGPFDNLTKKAPAVVKLSQTCFFGDTKPRIARFTAFVHPVLYNQYKSYPGRLKSHNASPSAASNYIRIME
ncbi:hypothetical protein [Caballeronia sp. LZ034LL]|uniref:hypothetical protein n=1 Tax=Caballeronia sp. LZ034LL TaxID=3038567 RepID=UPI00285EA696|nr:hypothetical protein [Caballeronia sp. LZ034LL]MDR5837864.1 hypothetical protein [Caballeronia sp. LZ034LL]